MTREDAHDLRHALAVILLWEQIARTSDSPEMRAAALDAIHKAVLEQAAMIDRLASHSTRQQPEPPSRHGSSANRARHPGRRVRGSSRRSAG